MKTTITGRHFNTTGALKSYIEGKISYLDKYVDDIINVHVVLEIERHLSVVEINVNLKSSHFKVKEKNEDMYLAIDESFDVLKQQVLKYEDRIKMHRHRDKDFKDENKD
ncbi:MAG: ribosome-associated translation inhibitor RaiA [Candidatus Kaelpia imicola]|nr:ribosome-associated translation inhibitor RaiA [Candidatus Kaelpia imicola]